MRIIQDLNSLVDLRKLNVLKFREDLADELFELSKSGEISSLEEGVVHFYPDNKIGQDNFNRLKRKLRGRLINTIFSTDINQKGYWERYFEAYKMKMVSELLRLRGKAHSSEKLAKEVLQVAIKYDYIKLVADVSRQLSYHYSVNAANRKEYERIIAIHQQYAQLDRWEDLAYDRYHYLAMELRLAKTASSTLIQKAHKYVKELDELSDQIQSVNFQHMRYNVALLLHQLENDPNQIITTCQLAIQFFEGLPFTPPSRAIRSFYFKAIPAFLWAADYPQAQSTIQKIKPLVKAGGHNWVGIHQYETILGFHLGDPGLVRSAMGAIRRSRLHRLIKEEFTIYEAYLAFLEDQQDYKLGKFLNQTIQFSADKKGMNINIRILQILIYLLRSDFDKIIDARKALEDYAYRYLKDDMTTRRSQLFFLLLFQLVRHSFDWSATKAYTQELLAELKTTPRHLSTIDIEVVPYEMLWEKVGEVLN
ncbi:MAG: hypothetical protein F6K19_17355 [Cyanothece sp. SIO1E1]|nr:hypothetical protein [Cyanothece sp. SIO1E1]